MAVEAYHDGYNPRSVRRRGESWHAFVGSMGDLLADQARVVERHRSWLEALEATEMTRSYKMVVLLGMLNADSFPGRCRSMPWLRRLAAWLRGART